MSCNILGRHGVFEQQLIYSMYQIKKPLRITPTVYRDIAAK